MTELDAFEQRFLRAYRSYLDEIAFDADPEAIAQGVLSNRRVLRWPSWSLWRDVPALRTAVVLLLAAALLAGFGVAYLLGMRPPIPTASCPAGTQPDVAGSADQPRPASPFIASALAFDPSLEAIVALEGARTWAFDVCANTWSRIGDGVPHEFAALAYDESSGVMLAVGSDGGAWTFDAASGRWVAHRSVPWADGARLPPYLFARVVYDDARGGVLAAWWDDAHVEVWSLEVDGDRWQPVWSGDPPWGPPTSGSSGYDPLMTWDAIADRLVVVRFAQRADHRMAGDTWLLDPLTARWTHGADAPGLGFGWFVMGTELQFADGVGLSIVIGDGTAIGYDAAADRWQVLSGAEFIGYESIQIGPVARHTNGLAYDRTNQRIVMVGGSYRTGSPDNVTWVDASDVWAFVPATGQWVQLLEPASPTLAPTRSGESAAP